MLVSIAGAFGLFGVLALLEVIFRDGFALSLLASDDALSASLYSVEVKVLRIGQLTAQIELFGCIYLHMRQVLLVMSVGIVKRQPMVGLAGSWLG